MSSKKQNIVAKKDSIKISKSFDEFVKTYNKKIEDINTNILITYWEIGGHVDQMVQKAVYGDKTIADVCQALRLSKTTVYACRQMYLLYTKEELEEKFIKTRIGFHTICKLIRIEDDKTREDLRKKIEKGEITLKDIKPKRNKSTEQLKENIKIEDEEPIDSEEIIEHEKTEIDEEESIDTESEVMAEDDDYESVEDSEKRLKKSIEAISDIEFDTINKNDKERLAELNDIIEHIIELTEEMGEAVKLFEKAAETLDSLEDVENNEIGIAIFTKGIDACYETGKLLSNLCQKYKNYSI